MVNPEDIAKEVQLAETRIRPHIRETILEHSLYLSQHGNANVYCKLENLQCTGSFKTRGAMNKVLSLTPEEQRRGVVTASTGNHGAAVAFSLNKLNASGIIFVPEIASPNKVEAIERLGAEVRYFGRDCVEAEAYARKYASENQMTYISPYNDLQVAAGQGTIGIELSRRLDKIDAVFVSLGGGGLISGIAGYFNVYGVGLLPAKRPNNSNSGFLTWRPSEIQRGPVPDTFVPLSHGCVFGHQGIL